MSGILVSTAPRLLAVVVVWAGTVAAVALGA